MPNKQLISINLIINLVLVTLFAFIAPLDIYISSLFYTPGLGFIYKKNLFVLYTYQSIPIITNIFVLSCSTYLLYLLFRYKNIKYILRSFVFFLLITSIIGPGLVVNIILKDNYGRARPRNIIEFSGNKKFTPVLVPSNQCDKNCSFPSGHSAMAFYLTAFAYMTNKKHFTKIYLMSIIFGVIVGMSRIVMGGHFASDIISSALIILALNHLTFICWKKLKEKLTI